MSVEVQYSCRWVLADDARCFSEVAGAWRSTFGMVKTSKTEINKPVDLG